MRKGLVEASFFCSRTEDSSGANFVGAIRRVLGACCLFLFPLVAHSTAIPDTPELRFATYNVLADADDAETRVPRLLEILRDTRADIIVLQEVAPWFAERLLREEWARAYHRPTRDGRTVLAHEYLVLSRFPVLSFDQAPLPGKQHRVYFAATLDLPTGPTDVATCHLESLLEDGLIRAQQLDVFVTRLAGEHDAIFAGDFNFGDGEQPETAHLSPEFRDAWLSVRPNDPGYTWNIEKSRMARDGSFVGEKSRRLDRILFRSKQWTPVSVEILGTEPVSPKNRRVFPSDHFGLLAVFRRNNPPVPIR